MANPHIARAVEGRPARPRRSRPLAAVSALTALSMITALGLNLMAAPAQAAVGDSSSTTGTTGTTTIAAPSVRQVTLVTGEHIDAITQNGSTRYLIQGAANGSDQLSTYQLPNGDRYDIPAQAQPYLGHQLPMSLFDTSALIRSGTTGEARIPVSLSFAAGATPTAPPGVTLTSTTGSTANGYLTPASTSQFAAGLRAAIGADVRAGRAPGTGALFGGLVSMSPAGSFGSMATMSSVTSTAGRQAAVIPQFPLHILEIDATDLTGAPISDALATVINTDSVADFNNYVQVVDGIARVAVPAGDYFAALLFYDFDDQGNLTAVRTVTVDDFSVAATGVSTVKVAESSANVPFTVTTPRPATQDAGITTWNRQDAAGNATDFGSLQFGPGAPQYFNAQPAPTVGKLRFTEQWDGEGPTTGAQYRYDLGYGYDDIPAVQTHAVKPSELATVRHTFYTDPAAQTGASFLSGLGESNQEISGAAPYEGDVTQYLGNGDGGQWRQSATTNGIGTTYDADLRTFTAGHQYRIEWGHGPLAPNVGKHIGNTYYPCSACASSGGVSVGFDLVGDSEPDHFGTPLFDTVTTHYTLYVDGAVAADADNIIGAETGPPAATGATTYREVYDVNRGGNADISQSTATHTDLSFVYDPQKNPGPVLPSDLYCSFSGVVTAPCNIMPVLNLSYHLTTDAKNTSKAPIQTLVLNVSHLSYDGLGSTAAIKSAAVSVSFDGGKTWKAATVIGAGGTYVALWQNPKSAAGTSPTIKVTATDAIGGSITQTATDAYRIASPSASAAS